MAGLPQICRQARVWDSYVQLWGCREPRACRTVWGPRLRDMWILCSMLLPNPGPGFQGKEEALRVGVWDQTVTRWHHRAVE